MNLTDISYFILLRNLTVILLGCGSLGALTAGFWFFFFSLKLLRKPLSLESLLDLTKSPLGGSSDPFWGRPSPTGGSGPEFEGPRPPPWRAFWVPCRPPTTGGSGPEFEGPRPPPWRAFARMDRGSGRWLVEADLGGAWLGGAGELEGGSLRKIRILQGNWKHCKLYTVS